jgi:hypothetical protein
MFNDLVKICSVTLPSNYSITLTDMSHDPEVIDSYLTAEVIMNRGDTMKLGKVVQQLTDDNNLPIGKSNDSPILDTRQCVVEFDDGEQLEYAGNVIAENIYA